MREFNHPNLILLNIGYSELNGNWNWKKVHSPFSRIYYVTEGSARTYFNNETHLLEAGNLYLVPPFTLHDDECPGSFSLFYIHFYEENITQESIFDCLEFPVKISATLLDAMLIKRLLETNPNRHLMQFDPALYDNSPTFLQCIAEHDKMPLHSLVETKGILCQLLSRFIESASIKRMSGSVPVNKALQYIVRNINEEISISELANVACVSEDHLIRTFKKHMNCTPLKYINAKKMEKAQLILLTTNISVKNIAYELSIHNVSYFNKIFKQHTGRTPSQYREEFSR